VVWESDDTDKQVEGCLSIPGIEEVVERPWAVRVEGYDPDGRPVSVEADDLLSRALQHEIDHLDGVLFLDRVSPIKRRMAMKKWKKLRAEADGA
jgi:peptide deformylase